MAENIPAVPPAKILRFIGWACLLIMGVRESLRHQKAVLTLPRLEHRLRPADPDNWLRLTQVRQWMRGGNFFDHTVAHTNAPFGGISIHWTRPVDFLADAFSHLGPASLPLDERLMIGASWLPVCLGLAAMVLLTRAASRIFNHTQVLGCLLLTAYFSKLALVWYFSPGVTDHHGPLCVLWCGVLALLLQPPSPRRGIAIGALLGLMLWISVEALLLIAPVYAILGLHGLRARAEEECCPLRPLTCAAAAAALVSMIGLCVEMPLSRMLSDVFYDTLSAPYVLLMLLCALGAAAVELVFLKSPRLPARLAAIGGTGAAVAAVMFFSFPKIFRGPLAGSDSFIFASFLPGIVEAQTLPAFFAHYRVLFTSEILQPALALLLVVATWRANLWRRREMGVLCALFVWTFLLTAAMVRWYYYLLPVSMILIAVLLPPWSMRLRVLARVPRMFRAYVFLALFMIVLETLLQKPPEPTTIRESCDLEVQYIAQTGQLQPLLGPGPAVLLTAQDVGPVVQFFTPYRVIAGNYQREGAGMIYLKAVGDAPDAAAARKLLRERRVDALLLCPDSEAGWLHGLADGTKLPSWLTRAGAFKYDPDQYAKPQLFRVR